VGTREVVGIQNMFPYVGAAVREYELQYSFFSEPFGVANFLTFYFFSHITHILFL
jgi:hypothetical protein